MTPQKTNDKVKYDPEDSKIATVSGKAPDLKIKGVAVGDTKVRAITEKKTICKEASVHVFALESIEAELAATMNPVTKAVPMQPAFKTTNKKIDFVPEMKIAADLMVVVQNAGAIAVTTKGKGKLEDAFTAGAVKWIVERNPHDTIGKADEKPGFDLVMGSPGMFKLTPNVPGSLSRDLLLRRERQRRVRPR